MVISPRAVSWGRLSEGLRSTKPGKSSVPAPEQLCSVFAPGVEVIGTLDAPGAVFLEGSFKGDLSAEHLTIGRRGALSGNVFSTTVETRGHLVGEVTTQGFRGLDDAHVEGIVRCSSVELQSGVSIKADVRTS